jgi:hypothetical protein
MLAAQTSVLFLCCQAPRHKMRAVLYRCPNTDLNVQTLFAEEARKEESYETVTCSACQALHYVNPSTGRVLGVERLQDRERK